MATIRIDKLVPGTPVVLLFQTGPSRGYEEDAEFVRIVPNADRNERRATFISTDKDGRRYKWDAYRFEGRWAYGSGANPLRVGRILGNAD